MSLCIIPPSPVSHERVYELISCVPNPDASAAQQNHQTCRVFIMKMEEDGFQPGAREELQSADDPTSSLASLCVTEEAAAISRSAHHMVDNPEPRSGFPGIMSSLSIQSKQQKEGAKVKPCPAGQGKVQQLSGKAAQKNRKQIKTRNNSPTIGLQQWARTVAGPR